MSLGKGYGAQSNTALGAGREAMIGSEDCVRGRGGDTPLTAMGQRPAPLGLHLPAMRNIDHLGREALASFPLRSALHSRGKDD